MRILLTGFEPFGDHAKNSSELVLEYFKNHKFIHTALLPVEHKNAFQIVSDLMDQSYYDYVVHLGQAAKREKISLERLAINVCDFPIEDNAGKKIVDHPVIEGGEAAYFSTLPIKKLEMELCANNLPCEISNTAGTYVCNEIMYRSLHKTLNQKTSVGFIHLPIVSEQPMNDSDEQLCLSQVAHGAEVILKYLLNGE